MEEAFNVEWFYVDKRVQVGPVSLEDLAQHARMDTLIWSDLMPDWATLEDSPEVLSHIQRFTLRIDGLNNSNAVAAPHPGNTSRGVSGSPITPIATAPAPVATAAMQSSRMLTGIRGFLLGWLPQREAPKDLVRRGILHSDPTSSHGAPFHRGGSAQQSELSSGIFGAHLSSVLQRPDTENGIPAVVRVLIAKLQANNYEGMRGEGVFRVPGDQREMQEIRKNINQGSEMTALVDSCSNLHSVAGLLKMYFRELPLPLLTFDLYDDFVCCAEKLGAPSDAADTGELHQLLQVLPEGHLTLLRHLITFLIEVSRFAPESKMTLGNVAAVFAPNLLRPRHETLEHFAQTSHVVNLVAWLMRSPSYILSSPLVTDSSATDLTEAHRVCQQQQVEHSDDNLLARARANPSTESARWFFLDQSHEQQGPVGWCDVQAMVQKNQLSGDSYVFTEGMPDWTQVADIEVSGPEPFLL